MTATPSTGLAAAAVPPTGAVLAAPRTPGNSIVTTICGVDITDNAVFGCTMLSFVWFIACLIPVSVFFDNNTVPNCSDALFRLGTFNVRRMLTECHLVEWTESGALIVDRRASTLFTGIAMITVQLTMIVFLAIVVIKACGLKALWFVLAVCALVCAALGSMWLLFIGLPYVGMRILILLAGGPPGAKVDL